MKKSILLFILVLWHLSAIRLCAQPVALTEIPALKRLPVNAIHRIFQDSEGYIWYGTVNGLCRDDGYRIQVFRADFNHPSRMDDNLIECIAEDRQGRIWFGTNKGAYILDKKDYTIRRIEHRKLLRRMVAQIYTTSDGDLWVSTEGTLLRFNPDGTCRKEYETRNGVRPTILAGFCEGRKGEVIIALSDGLVCRLDKKKDCFVPFPDKMRHHNPGCILRDRDHDYFWMCTWGDGLVRFDPSATGDSLFVYRTPATPESRNLIYAALDKERNLLWVTSTTHLLAYEISGGEARPASDYGNLPANVMLNDIIRGHNGDFWVSAFDRPGFILHNCDDRPKTYSLPALQTYCDYRPAVMAICDSGEGIVWMFQERTGVFLYDLERDRASYHRDFPTTAHLPFAVVKLIVPSRRQHSAWVAPEFKPQAYRLTRDDMAMSFVDSVDFAPHTHHDALTALYEEQAGRYLYAGTRRGLFRCDLQDGRVTAVCDTMGHVTGIIEAEDHTLYICTYDKGAYAIGPKGDIRHYPLPQAFSCLARTTDGRLWMGSDGGDLVALDPHDGTVQSYNATCNLNGDMINRIAADEFNHIWIDTNQKIIELNPHNGSYHTYLTSDGSAGLWRLIPTALCKGPDGYLYFGGIPGICRFKPSNALEREATPADVVITDLRTDNRSLFFDMNRTRDRDGSIGITAREENLTVCFSSLNHRAAHKIRYAYRMRGIDKQWQYLPGGVSEAVYSHLPKGTYDFEVKATDENGQWSRTTTTLRLRRLPAWYETWWAYLIYIGQWRAVPDMVYSVT